MTKQNPLPLVLEDVQGFFGKRPLVAGEKPAAYDALFSKIAATVNPGDFIEWLYVRDYVDLTWEIQRIRRFQDGIINNGRVEALGRLLEPVTYVSKYDEYRTEYNVRRNAQSDAKAYWSDNAKEKKAITSEMAKYGFDDAAIIAEAFGVKLPTIEITDRMVAAAESRRKKILKEIERRREAIPRSARKVIDAESTEILRLADPNDSKTDE
jgi:hypothetical protein